MNVVSRADALAAGMKRYFTGAPCKRGHLAERLAVNMSCVLCTQERQRAAYAANPEAGRAQSARWRSANPEKKKASDRAQKEKNKERVRRNWQEYYAKNKEKLLAAKAEYVGANRERYLAGQRNWRERNVAVRTALQAERKARKKMAMPPWFGELDEFVWREAMSLARLRGELTGVPWAADHMVPLAARNACGLHAASNCQVIPSDLNGRKANKLILTEPDEWLQYI